MSDKTVWGIHAGRTGDADDLFLKKNRVALGWYEVGDLSSLPANRDAFKELLVRCLPDTKPGAVAVEAGQLFRFIHEIRVGDFIVYPSKRDREIHIGEITGTYDYNPSLSSHYPQQRAVIWKRSVPRTSFSQGALYVIGSAMSLFQVENYAEEFLAAIEGHSVPTAPSAEEDETVSFVAQTIEDNTRDYLLKKLAQELKGHGLAHLVAHLLEKMGYRTRISPPGPDRGVDIIAHKDDLGFEPPIIKVQVKSSEGKVGSPEVQALHGNIGSSNEYGLFVTLGTFTPAAVNFAHDKSKLRLIDGTELIRLILQYYEQFDSSYKRLLPLKRVYIPQPYEETEE